MERAELIDRLNGLRPLFEAEGVEHIALFGSRARSDHKADSDVDLLVEFKPNGKFDLLDLIGIEHIVADEVGLLANAVVRRSLKPQFTQKIAPEIIEIF